MFNDLKNLTKKLRKIDIQLNKHAKVKKRVTNEGVGEYVVTTLTEDSLQRMGVQLSWR